MQSRSFLALLRSADRIRTRGNCRRISRIDGTHFRVMPQGLPWDPFRKVIAGPRSNDRPVRRPFLVTARRLSVCEAGIEEFRPFCEQIRC